MNNRGRWRIGAMASAIALLGSLASLEAHAVALGRITVQSALGESLRAEIDISDLNAEEVSSLRIGVASADVFKSAGFEYTAAVAGLDVRLQRRADGRSYLRLSSNRAITEPFVDLILEAKWASGRVTRDYTMLFDPPNLRPNSAAMAAPAAPVVSRAPAPRAEVSPREITPPLSPRPVARPAPVARAPAPRPAPAEKMSAGPGATQVKVKPGDNASRIAARNKPASVSLDQMLVAMLRSNPEAFVGGNINVLKSGAVLDIPDAQTAISLASGDAKQTLVAQSTDFNGFRRKLADGAPVTQADSADRQAGGKVQARVEDRAQASTPPDKLTLSKGAVQSKPASAAEELAARDAASRTEGPPKNSSNLGKTGKAPDAGTPAVVPGLVFPPVPGASSALGAAGAPGITATPAQLPASVSTPVAGEAQSPLLAASEPAPAVKAAVAPAPTVVKQPAVIAPPPPASGLIDQMMGNSLLLMAGGGALLALLAGLGFASYRKKKKPANVDSSFLDSRLQPDSFFGASGGRRVDTSESNVGGSSIVYSPSQIDATGDVDPVAEADVYLAYGRDQQAEEILREALRNHPKRLAIHTKLLEILAKRRDIKAFETVAQAAFKQSKGQGGEWVYISQLGRELDPSNPTYQPGAEPTGSLNENGASDFMPVSAITPLDAPVVASDSKNSVGPIDLDLDLDFSLDEAPVASMTPAASIASAPLNLSKASRPGSGIAMPSAVLSLDEIDLDLDNIPAALPVSARPSLSPAPAVAKASSSPEIDFLSEGLDFTSEPYVAPKSSIAPPAPITQSGMLEFDLNSLSLDLGPEIKTSSSPGAAEPEDDPLEIKFLLAEEFRILGDSDGARSLADEVMTKARGPLKVKAQAFLNSLM